MNKSVLGFYLWGHSNVESADYILGRMRESYPDSDLVISSDNGRDFSRVVKKHNAVKYIHGTVSHGYPKSEERYGWTAEQAYLWLHRIYEACQAITNDYVMLMEEDILVKERFRFPACDIVMIPNIRNGISVEGMNWVKSRGGKTNYPYYSAGGGTIINRLAFINSFDNHIDSFMENYETIYEASMKSNFIGWGWNDSIIAVLMYANNATISTELPIIESGNEDDPAPIIHNFKKYYQSAFNQNLKFIIWSYEYTKKWGGVIVLHKLGKMLSELGYEVNLIAKNTIENSNCNLISQDKAQNLIKQDNSYFVIYPQNVVGNPLNSENVIRWVLYYPGVLGGEKNYSNNEIVFSYNKLFVKDTKYESAPILFTFESRKDYFKDLGLSREGVCYLEKKGSIKNLKIDGYKIDHILSNNDFDEKLLEIFNKYKYFISFDHATYHSILAALCGCISIVIPANNLTKDEWTDKIPLAKYGISYGLDDINWALNTKHLLFNHISDLENESKQSVLSFIEFLEKKNKKYMKRYDIINIISEKIKAKRYLEIGVYNPNDCFNKINVLHKESVDPGTDGLKLATHIMTSDDFFSSASKDTKWDIIFIDGLHTGEQVYKDVINSLNHLSDTGYIVLHDCNPPTIYHAREYQKDYNQPAGYSWNGTVWKAFQRLRSEKSNELDMITVDTDWGVGVIRRGSSKSLPKDFNSMYDYHYFDTSRKEVLNLVDEKNFIEWILK